MKEYEVIVSEQTVQKLRKCLSYLIDTLQSHQAAKAVFEDYVETRKRLQDVAGSIRFCENIRLAKLGYRRINFRRHNYFLLYRIDGQNVYVDYLFHGLEDAEKILN